MARTRRDVFATVRTEGGLLPPELLQSIVEGNGRIEGLSPASYHLAKNEKLNEVISRAWTRCSGAWSSFRQASGELVAGDLGTTVTRERWLLILFQELGYGRLLTAKAQEAAGRTFPISHMWQNTPIHLVSFKQDVDKRTPGVAGAAQMSPHSLVQEFLNHSHGFLWGIVSNGLRLRLLRDNLSFTRQVFVEFDLESMMDNEVYTDFVLLFLLLHQSRVEAEQPEECWLERWSQAATEVGKRALDKLQEGVREAIADLGRGFLGHPANNLLRDTLRSGSLTTVDYYRQLLRLVYRIIFLLAAEDRELLLVLGATPEARKAYMNYYSMSRIRRLAGQKRGTRHGDVWQGLKIAFGCMAKGQEKIGVPALNGTLFSADFISALNGCELSNEAMLEAVRHLAYILEGRVRRPVDYRNIGTEEWEVFMRVSLSCIRPSTRRQASSISWWPEDRREKRRDPTTRPRRSL